jgi:hypothetical protein
LRLPLENTSAPVHGLPCESIGSAACPLAMKWQALRASVPLLSGVSEGSVPRTVEPVSSRLIVYATASMCPNSSAAMFAMRS